MDELDGFQSLICFDEQASLTESDPDPPSLPCTDLDAYCTLREEGIPRLVPMADSDDQFFHLFSFLEAAREFFLSCRSLLDTAKHRDLSFPLIDTRTSLVVGWEEEVARAGQEEEDLFRSFVLEASEDFVRSFPLTIDVLDTPHYSHTHYAVPSTMGGAVKRPRVTGSAVDCVLLSSSPASFPFLPSLSQRELGKHTSHEKAVGDGMEAMLEYGEAEEGVFLRSLEEEEEEEDRGEGE